jgi:hypothetical protein
MLSYIIYALVIVGQGGQETVVANFPTRDWCVAEAQRVREQGPAAYCFPTNQATQEDIQRQFDNMLVLMRQFREGMEQQ